MRRILAIPRMRLYYLGNGLSSLGDYALWLAAGIWVRELTGSTAQAGLTFLFLTVGTLLSPVTGFLVDRVRRRPLIVCVNLVTALLVLSLALVHHADQVWLIYTVMFLYGLSATLSSSAISALLPKMVPEDLLGEANGLSQALSQGQRLITPAIGVGLLALYGGGAVALMDAVTFVAGAVCWMLIEVDDEKPQPFGESWRRETTAGFTFLIRSRVLRQLTGALTVAVFAMGFFETLGIAVATVGLHHAATWTGTIVTTMGVTGIVGGISAGRLMKRLGAGRLTALGLVIVAGGALLLAVPVDAVVLGGSMLFGLALPYVIVGSMTAIQLNTPNDLMGRVMGADNFLVTSGQALGIGAGAAMISIVFYRDLCYFVAAVFLLAALFLATRPEQRALALAVPDGGERMSAAAVSGDAEDPARVLADGVGSSVGALGEQVQQRAAAKPASAGT
jgi:MFS family permease